jgi:flagellar biosynthesis protein FliR
LLAGLFLRLCVITLQIAGSVAAQATSLSHLVAGAGGEPLPAIGHVLVLAGLTLAIISGLPEALAQYVLLSYEMFPVGEWPSSTALVSLIISHVGNAFMLGFSLACPFVLIALVYNLVLGAINRAMPQLMVALVGAPAISFAALAMLAISAPFMIEVWRNTLFDLLTKGALP